MSARRVFVFLACACLGALGPAAPAVGRTAAVTDLYVATDGSDGNACTTAAEPCQTIAHAMTLAADTGTTIHVANGQYGEPIAPGSKHVTVVGAGSDSSTGTVIAATGIGAGVSDANGMLTLRSVVLDADTIGMYVTAGNLDATDVSITTSPCGVLMSGGSVTLTDSVISKAGSTGATTCVVSSSPHAVTVNAGSLALVRSKVVDTKYEAGVVVNGGTFSASDSVFSDAAYAASDSHPNPTVLVAGGVTSVQRSLFQADQFGLETTGGLTTVSDSTFYDDGYGTAASGPSGSEPTVLRSTFVEAQILGPARLAGDALTYPGGQPCLGTPTDLGYNYGAGSSCAFTVPTSRNDVTTANLAEQAADHGGVTPTVAMTAPSALVDAIPANATWGAGNKRLCAGTTDQRGVGRPQGGGCDVGAFEAAATQTVVTAAPSPASPGAKVTLTAKISPHAGAFRDPDPVAGTVTFEVGGTVLCSGVQVTAGAASCATTKLPAGTPTVTATFTSASPYRNGAGSRKLIIGTVPKFTTAAHATVTIGRRKSITVRVAASPAATIFKARGALPKGLRFVGGSGRATITGRPARGTARKYVLYLGARNVRGYVTQKFTLVVRKV